MCVCVCTFKTLNSSEKKNPALKIFPTFQVNFMGKTTLQYFGQYMSFE